MSQTQPPIKPGMKPTAVVYWLRVVLAIAAGFANQLLGISETRFGAVAFPLGIGVGLVFYVLSIIVIRRLLGYGPTELKGKNRHITLGGGTFIVLWITIAVLLNTVAGWLTLLS